MTTHNTSASTRLERINSEIAQEISQFLLTNIDDKRLKAAVITRAVTSKDLSIAKIYFSVIDQHIDTKQLTKLLNNAAGIFRHHIAEALDLRITPAIKFYYDEEMVKTQHLLDLLEKI